MGATVCVLMQTLKVPRCHVDSHQVQWFLSISRLLSQRLILPPDVNSAPGEYGSLLSLLGCLCSRNWY